MQEVYETDFCNTLLAKNQNELRILYNWHYFIIIEWNAVNVLDENINLKQADDLIWR